MNQSEEWAIRCTHEAAMHKKNSFITLTFDKEHLPEDYSVQVRTWQLFMKKLRKQYGSKIRFFACGEYGDLTLRPHYHALLFNHDWSDKIFYKTTQNNDTLYTSSQLTNLWNQGHCTTGDVTYKSAAYAARYCLKKINGEPAANHYWRQHPDSKKMVSVQPEFALSSRRPGLGDTWFKKYQDECVANDSIIIEGRVRPIPRFYMKQLPEEVQEKLKRDRGRLGRRYTDDHTGPAVIPEGERRWNKTPERLAVREEVFKAKINRLKRTL